MNLLTPASLALLAFAIPILLLWMLRLRRRDVTVSSTMLWQALLRDREANAPWQRLRRNLLLFLQLVILIALVLALARPFFPVPAVASGAVVLLLDASASMKATDVSPSRFLLAQQAAEDLVSGLGSDGLMTVISVGIQPRVLAAATKDKNILREAIAAAQVEQGLVDWAPAFALAAGASSGAGESTTVIISDGNLPPDLPPLPGEVRYIPIGREEGTSNFALTALATREGTAGLELFVQITHSGPVTQAPAAVPLLSIYLDGTLYESRRVVVPAGENKSLTLTGLPEEISLIEARLVIDDPFALDNSAWAVNKLGGEQKALLISEGNIFLERAVASLPSLSAFRASPAGEIPSGNFDLVIFDSVLPDPLPDIPLLIINPPENSSLLTVSGTFSDTQVTQVSDTPLLNYVDFSQVQILEARHVEVPSWSETLVRAHGGPLLLAGETGGRRVAVLTFDLHQSDLPLQIAFPVLIANLTEWLTPGLPFDAGDVLGPGEPLTLFPGDAESLAILRPDGRRWSPPPSETMVFAETEDLGLYQVEIDGAPAGQFAVNLFDPAESDLSRQETITVGRAEIGSGGEQKLGQRELWPWLAGVALLVLAIEWWVYHRGIGPGRER